MDSQTLAAITRKPDMESERREFPAGFPDPIDVPGARYTDPELAALELEHVLKDSWLFAAHAGQIPNEGDFLKLDMFDKMGFPLFLLRGADGVVRCFYNSCRHRGGPLVDEDKGTVGKRLVCKYHAWTYTHEGSIVGFPEAKNFPRGIRKSCPSLKTAQCESYGPLIFVKLTEGGPDLRSFLGPIADEIDTLVGDKSTNAFFAGERTAEVKANWKMPVDGNIETYHVPYVHADTAGPILDEQKTGQWLLPNGHSRMLCKFRAPLPKKLPTGRFNGDTSIAELGIYSFHIFPNLSLVFGGPATCFLITSLPVKDAGSGTCSYQTVFISPQERTPETEKFVDRDVAFNWEVLLEDLAALGASQKSIEAGGIDTLRLQYQERRLRYFQEEIDRRIGVENVPEALRLEPVMDPYVEER